MKVIMVDDELIILDLIVDGIKKIDGSIEFIGLVSSAAEAIELCKKTAPDLVIMDLQLRKGEIDGISATSEIKKVSDNIKVIAFSSAYEPYIVSRAFDAGADTYLPKGVLTKDLVYYMNQTLNHNYRIIHPSIRIELENYNNSIVNKFLSRKEFNYGLSEAEITIIKYLQMPEDLSLKEIASRMNYTYASIKNIISDIYKFLGFTNKENMNQKQQLIEWANVNLIGYDYLVK